MTDAALVLSLSPQVRLVPTVKGFYIGGPSSEPRLEDFHFLYNNSRLRTSFFSHSQCKEF